MNGFTRFGGTMEIAGINNKINLKEYIQLLKPLNNITTIYKLQKDIDNVERTQTLLSRWVTIYW